MAAVPGVQPTAQPQLMHAVSQPDTCQELDVHNAAMQSVSGFMSLR